MYVLFLIISVHIYIHVMYNRIERHIIGDVIMSKQKKSKSLLYEQLVDTLSDRIQNNIYKSGEMIPSELELQHEFGVSRSTVRKALNILSQKNILMKIPGKGTFVSDKKSPIETNSKRFLSFTDNVKRSGKKLTTKLIYTKDVDNNEKQCAFFNIQESEKLVKIKRLRYLDGEPFCIESTWLSEKYSDITNEDLDGSLYQILRKKYDSIPNNGQKTFKITFATQEESFLLDVSRGSALMKINDYVYDQNGAPLHISEQILKGDKFTYAVNQ